MSNPFVIKIPLRHTNAWRNKHPTVKEALIPFTRPWSVPSAVLKICGGGANGDEIVMPAILAR